MSFQAQNVFEAIVLYGHDEDFQPQVRGNWRPTEAAAGSTQKIEVLRHRVELGVPLFHPNDNPECLRSPYALQVKRNTVHVVKLLPHRPVLLSE